uniref:Regulator of nonsense transcripts 1 homolog n=1 Tax=Culex pipiens TaxID=7175 RepID=A0A8D8NWX2_CULPI
MMGRSVASRWTCRSTRPVTAAFMSRVRSCYATSARSGSRTSAAARPGRIVNHLMRAKHREVTLHGDEPLGETTTKCWAIQGSKGIQASKRTRQKRIRVAGLLVDVTFCTSPFNQSCVFRMLHIIVT